MERPILFSAPMVRAILAGAKTQTRRIIKPQPTGFDHEPKHLHAVAGDKRVFCPYGCRGSRLWVREAFRFLDTFDGDSPSNIAFRCSIAGYKETWAPIHYEADGMSPVFGMRRWRDYAPRKGRGEIGEIDGFTRAATSYETLWEQINGHGSWVANPWVWCVSFRRVKP
jgi:hypothetical protein